MSAVPKWYFGINMHVDKEDKLRTRIEYAGQTCYVRME